MTCAHVRISSCTGTCTIVREKTDQYNLSTLSNTLCWISNNNTLDIPCTPNAQEARRPLSEFDFTISIPVI